DAGGKFADWMNSAPLLKLVVAPFVHRPLNMLRQSIIDYTPLGILNPAQRALLKGNNADTDVALSRMLLGTGGLATGYELAASGKATGARAGYRNTDQLDNVPA